MPTRLLLLTMLTVALADETTQVTLRNPQDFARVDIVAFRLGDLGIELPADGSLEVRDDEGNALRSQLDDLDLSGGPSPDDELVFEVRMGPYETVTVEIGPGPGEMSQAERLPNEDLWVRGDKYHARIMAQGGWLGDLRHGKGPNLIGHGMEQMLWSGGFEPPAAFHQGGLSAEMIRCRGPLREAVIARYDLDEKPFVHRDVAHWAGELRTGYTGEVLYAFYPDHMAVTHRMVSKDLGFPVETCRVVASLPLPRREPTVFDHWATATGEGDVPADADLRVKGWQQRPDLVSSPWLQLTGPKAGLTLVADLRTAGKVSFVDAREAGWGSGDFLCYTRFMDSAESTMWLVPHRPGDDVRGLLDRLSHPLECEGVDGHRPAELDEARAVVGEAAAALQEARRGEAFLTPAEIQVRAAEQLLAMAEVCAQNDRLAQAARLAREATRRAEIARGFIAGGLAAGVEPPEIGRDGSVFLGVYFGGNGKAFPDGWERSLRRLKRYGISCVHDMETLSWRNCEPEQGEFTFTQADAYLDMLKRLGIQYLPCIDPWQRKPAWVEPGPGVWPLIGSYYAQVIPRYRSRDLILAWAISNEPSSSPPADIASKRGSEFRRWLEARYVDVETLNAAWGRGYGSFGELRIPRLSHGWALPKGETALDSEDVAYALENAAATRDLNLFAAQELTGDLGRLAALARELDPERPVVVKSADAMVAHSPARVGNPWSLRDVQRGAYCHDFCFRPELGKVGGGFGDYRLGWAFATALERSALGKQPIWCSEFHQGWWGKPLRCATRAQTRLMTWTAVAEGLRGSFGSSHPSGQWPVGNFDDSPVPLLEEYGVLSAEFKALGPLICSAEPWPARIAIYYPLDSILYKFGGRRETNLRDPNGPRGPLRSLWQALSVGEHYPVKFLDDEAMLSGELSGFRALVLVEAEFLSEEVARRAAQFAADGGTLIIMGPCGMYDSYAHRHARPPGGGLRELIGARLTAIREGTLTASGRDIAVDSATACYEIEAEDVNVLASLDETDEAVAFSRDMGPGSVLILGANLGVATDTPDGAGRRWLASQLQARGILPPVVDNCPGAELPPLYARVFTQEGRGHLLLANLAGKSLQIGLTLAEEVALSEQPFDLLTGRMCARVGGHSIEVELAADDVMWVCL